MSLSHGDEHPRKPPPHPTPSTNTSARVGAALLVLSTLQFFTAHFVVESAWTVVPYSWWNNYLSDLGAVHCGEFLGNMVCSPRHALINTSIAIQGAGLIIGILLTANTWLVDGRRRVWQTMVVIAGLSYVMVGLVPEDVNFTLHAIVASPLFFVGNAALLVAGASASTRNRPAIRRAATILGSLGFLGIILIVVARSAFGGDGVGAAERLAVFPLQLWGAALGLVLLHTHRRTAVTAGRRVTATGS